MSFWRRLRRWFSNYAQLKSEAQEAVKAYYGLSCEPEDIYIAREEGDGNKYEYYVDATYYRTAGKNKICHVEIPVCDEVIQELIDKYMDAQLRLIWAFHAVFFIAMAIAAVLYWAT